MQKSHKELGKKIISLCITILFIGLILFVLVPPATSVNLTTGYPFSNNEIIFGNTITFNDVNLTIRGEERIPVTLLNFSIFNESSVLIDSLEFDIQGNEQNDANNVFTVVLDSTIQSSWYDFDSGYGYNEPDGPAYDFGYGYGYGGGSSDITFLYDINYTIRQSGTYYARLYVNSTPTNGSYSAQTFNSEASSNFAIEDFTLYEGWNLLSIPVLCNISASQLAENITNCDMVSWFDAENQTYRTYVNGSPAYDFDLVEGYGLFLYMSQNMTINISGAEITTVSIPLNNTSEGWNMIGWFNSTSSNSNNLQSTITGCQNVSWFDTSIDQFRTDIYNVPVYDFDIHRGLGIFVQVNASSTWNG